MQNKWIVWIFILIIIGIIGGLAYFDDSEDYTVITDQSVPLNRSWMVSSESLSDKEINLPAKINVEPGEVYKIRTNIPEHPGKAVHLLLRASMQDLVVKLDDEVLYEHSLGKSREIPFLPQASLWILVPLPEPFAGKDLTIEIKSEIGVFSGTLNAIRIGDKSDLLLHIINSQIIGITIFLILFITGLVVLALTSVLRSFKDNRILYLGFLSVSTSIWILSESRVLQFFTGNRFILGGISYIMIPLIGLFLVLFVKEAIAEHKNIKRNLQWIASGFGLIIAVMIGAQTLLNLAFINVMRITSVFMILLMVATVATLYHEYKKWGNDQVKGLKKYILIVLISIFLEAVVFYTGRFEFTSTFLRVGILIVLSGLLVDSYLYLKESIEKQKELQLLEVLAYKDFLTDGGNRTAYDRDLDGLMNRGLFRLVLTDMNYLKKINDEQGHSRGDIAIKAVFDSISKSFSTVGTCYRIGGDEFVVLMKDIEENLYQKCLVKLELELEKEKKRTGLPLEIAVGSDVYMAKIWPDFRKFYHHVDQKMYENKVYRKQKHLNESEEI
jgi:diguanylate cyclase (GGDEF)-like protein